MTNQEKALKLHEELTGKLETVSKIPVKTREDLALAYTPGVAEPCKVIAQDKSKAYTYTMKANTVAVVSDGSAVLGLGNIGPEAAMPVMEGKAVLFKEFGGVNAVPICLDTQDTEEIIKAVTWLAPGFGGINLEDISAPRCFEIEERLKATLDIPVFHDDQHGTAIVVLAGIINALKVVGKKKEDCHIVVNGAGSAGVAITRLLLTYGFPDIVMCDKSGILCDGDDSFNRSSCSFIARLLSHCFLVNISYPLTIAKYCFLVNIFCGDAPFFSIRLQVSKDSRKKLPDRDIKNESPAFLPKTHLLTSLIKFT